MRIHYNGFVIGYPHNHESWFHSTRPVISILRNDVDINIDTTDSTPVLSLVKVTM